MALLGSVGCNSDAGESTDVTTSGSSGTSQDDAEGHAAPRCGNGIVDTEEACDTTELAGASCASLGYVSGTLACTRACSLDESGCTDRPGAPVLALSLSPVKRLDLSWAPAVGADHYQLEESVAPGEPFVPLAGDLVGTSVSFTMPLHLRHQASYRLRACNAEGCTSSAPVTVAGSLAEAVGYVKASNTDADDLFGWNIALSEDGSTLAVGAVNEDAAATGIDGDQADDSAPSAGAVYVYVRGEAGEWSQQAYLKASNTGADDRFGCALALSEDGSTLAVGAQWEDGAATGIDGDQGSEAAPDSGSVYVLARDGMGTWSQQAYVKASNTGAGDRFGVAVALSDDGRTLGVGAVFEGSNATGVDGDQANDAAPDSGAAYVFERDDMGEWSQRAYLKASNTGVGDRFGLTVALSASGNTLAVGAAREDADATGIDGDQQSDAAPDSGAVYVFERDGMGTWSQQAYIKASNTGAGDGFGVSLSLNDTGDTLAVGAPLEDSDAAPDSGAVHVFGRDGLGEWSQQAHVEASNAGPGDQFGASVALSRDGTILAGSGHGEDGDATGIDGDQGSDAASDSGAAYVLERDGSGEWRQRAYVKASNAEAGDLFGWRLALSGDGHTLVVSAEDDGDGIGIGGDQRNDEASRAGAVYLY